MPLDPYTMRSMLRLLCVCCCCCFDVPLLVYRSLIEQRFVSSVEHAFLNDYKSSLLRVLDDDIVPWNDVWHELQEEGWISLRPRGRELETRWKYVRNPAILAAYAEDPIGAPKPIENVDFFYGPEAVRCFLRTQQATTPASTPVDTPSGWSSHASTDYGCSPSWPMTPAIPAQPDIMDNDKCYVCGAADPEFMSSNQVPGYQSVPVCNVKCESVYLSQDPPASQRPKTPVITARPTPEPVQYLELTSPSPEATLPDHRHHSVPQRASERPASAPSVPASHSSNRPELAPCPEESFQFCRTCNVRINDEHTACDCPHNGGRSSFSELLRRPAVSFCPSLDVNLDPSDVLQQGESKEELDGLESGDEDEDDEWFEDQEQGDDTVKRPGNEEDTSDDEDQDQDELYQISESLIAQIGGSIVLGNGDFETNRLRGLKWTPPQRTFEGEGTSYPGLSKEPGRPNDKLFAIADSPLQLFFYFLPRHLWKEIAMESNRYRQQGMEARVDKVIAAQRKRRRSDPEFEVETRADIRRKLRKEHDIEPHELTTVIGLMIANVLCRDVRRFTNHWSTSVDGALPSGTFGHFMSRNRFSSILKNLHFCNNEEVRPVYDKCWKLRRVITVMQDRFQKGWTLPPVISFDESVLPNHSRMNTTRMYMKDKPHRWGTKLFEACDAKSAYCYRFEVYVGSKQGDTEAHRKAHKAGAAAVIRNPKILLENKKKDAWHMVVLDRYYSAVALSLQLFTMQVYSIGTIMPDRLGYDQAIRRKGKTLPQGYKRGDFNMSRSVDLPGMMAMCWFDNKPVHFIATGATASQSSVTRRVQIGRGRTMTHGAPDELSAPQLVRDYHKWMGGVDVHNQLRLQSYSIQTSIRFRKYYKSLFFGFVDMAIVNGFITHKEVMRAAGRTPMKRAAYMTTLHNQLLQVKAADFEAPDDLLSPAPRKRSRKAASGACVTHTMRQSQDWYGPADKQRRRQRACKVCALLRGEKSKSWQTTFYCEQCSPDSDRLLLTCSRVRGHPIAPTKTCWQIWHEDFDCGNDIPESLKHRVQYRRSRAAPGGRKKTRRELNLQRQTTSDGDDSVDENDMDSVVHEVL